jgi:hypothetical protein
VDAAGCHLLDPGFAPGSAEAGFGRGQGERQLIAAGIGSVGSAARQLPTGLFQQRHALLRIEGVAGEIRCIAGVGGMAGRNN